MGTKFLNFSSDGVQRFADGLRQHIQHHTSKARSSYHEIFSDPMLKKNLQVAVEQLSKMDGEKLKKKLHNFIRSDKPVLRSFTKRIGTFYTPEDLSKFYKFVKKLDRHARRNKDMSEIIKEWLDFGIFDRYNKLNYTSKVKLLTDMNLIKDYLNGNTRFRAEDEPVTANGKKNDVDVSGSEGDDVHKHHRHEKKENDKHKHKHGNETSKEHDGRKTEVIVDNVEFFLKTVDD